MLLQDQDSNAQVPDLLVKSSLTAPEARFSTEGLDHFYFECQVEGIESSWNSCSSPYDLTNVVDRGFKGLFKVRSVSANGAKGPVAKKYFTSGFLPRGFNRPVAVLATGANGTTVVGGAFSVKSPESTQFMGMLNSDGTVHSVIDAFDERVSAIAVQPDGKVLVGGDFTSYGGDASSPDRIIRLNADGSEDLSFRLSAGVGFDGQVYALSVQPDGKILVGGGFTSYAGDASSPDYIIRLNADGSEDLGFRASALGGADSFVISLAVQDDGGILAGGYFTAYAGDASAPDRIIRLNSDGSEDLAFRASADSGFDANVNVILVQPDDKILLGGAFTTYAGDAATPDNIIRLNSDGSEDLAFRALAGVGFNDRVVGLAIQPDEKILVGGAFISYSGDASSPDRIIRLNSDGSEDLSFRTSAGDGFDAPVGIIRLQPDGKIVVSGGFTTYAGDVSTPDNIVRLNSNGTEDLSFRASATAGFNNSVYAMDLRSDGKILLGGLFSNYAGDAASPDYISQLNSDGSEVKNFKASAERGFDASTSAVAVQSDGKILVGGAFTSYAGDASAPDRIIRLNSDGTEDLGFRASAGEGFDDFVSAIAVQPNGKLIMVGNFETYSGTGLTPNGIVRLNTDGSEDLDFRASAGSGFNNMVHALALQPDGKILVGGSFGAYASDADTPDYLVRLNPNGEEDTSFRASAGEGFDGYVSAILVDSAGKILVGGAFLSYSGDNSAPDRLIRLDSDGSEDLSFK